MDGALIFEKTAEGEAAVNQRTRLVQRNLRTVLIMVDGTATVAALADEIGNAALVDDALQQLLDEGLIQVRAAPEDVELAAVEQQAIHPAAPQAPVAASIPNPFATTGPAGARAVPVEDEPLTAAQFKPIDVATLSKTTSVSKPRVGRAGIAAGVAAALVAGFVALWLGHSAETHRPAAVAALAGALGGEVTIGALATTGVPPTLVLREVTVKVGAATASFDELRAGLGFGVLFGMKPPLHELSARGARLDVGVVAALAAPREGDGSATARRLRLTNAQVRIGTVEVGDLSGEIEWADNGRLVRADLAHGGDQWSAALAPAGDQVQLTLAAAGVKGFPEKTTILDAVKLVGVLDAEAYRIEQVDIRAFDGLLEGMAEIAWQSGWRVSAAVDVKQVGLARVAAAFGSPLRIEGTGNAALRYAASATTPGELWSGGQGDGHLEVGGGRLLGVDLVDAVRRAGRNAVSGGETRFDNLTTSLRWRGGTLELDDLRLSAGLMGAEGQVRMAENGLSGLIRVAVGSASTRVAGAMAVIGTTREPAVRRP